MDKKISNPVLHERFHQIVEQQIRENNTMSNCVNIVPTQFVNMRDGTSTFGVRIYDEYDCMYSNLWEKEEIQVAPRHASFASCAETVGSCGVQELWREDAPASCVLVLRIL